MLGAIVTRTSLRGDDRGPWWWFWRGWRRATVRALLGFDGWYLDLESRRAARCASKLHAGLDVDVSSLEKTAENVKPALAIPAEEAKPPAKVRGPRGGRRRRQQQYRA